MKPVAYPRATRRQHRGAQRAVLPPCRRRLLRPLLPLACAAAAGGASAQMDNIQVDFGVADKMQMDTYKTD